MLKLVVCMFTLVTTCFAQEHLACVRTDNVLTQTPQRIAQGPPGKRGPKGQVGLSGNKGQKGEPGISGDSQMNLVRHQLNSLTQELKALKNKTKQNSRIESQLNLLYQEVEALKNQSRQHRKMIEAASNVGLLFVRPYFYVYKFNPSGQSWQESREFCQSWGGDLAMHGVKTLENRRILIQKLSINYFFWIGVREVTTEGNWIWVNGQRASGSELLWGSGEPNSGPVNKDCGDVGADTARAYDYTCTSALPGLCEKAI